MGNNSNSNNIFSPSALNEIIPNSGGRKTGQTNNSNINNNNNNNLNSSENTPFQAGRELSSASGGNTRLSAVFSRKQSKQGGMSIVTIAMPSVEDLYDEMQAEENSNDEYGANGLQSGHESALSGKGLVAELDNVLNQQRNQSHNALQSLRASASLVSEQNTYYGAPSLVPTSNNPDSDQVSAASEDEFKTKKNTKNQRLSVFRSTVDVIRVRQAIQKLMELIQMLAVCVYPDCVYVLAKETQTLPVVARSAPGGIILKAAVAFNVAHHKLLSSPASPFSNAFYSAGSAQIERATTTQSGAAGFGSVGASNQFSLYTQKNDAQSSFMGNPNSSPQANFKSTSEKLQQIPGADIFNASHLAFKNANARFDENAVTVQNRSSLITGFQILSSKQEDIQINIQQNRRSIPQQPPLQSANENHTVESLATPPQTATENVRSSTPSKPGANIKSAAPLPSNAGGGNKLRPPTANSGDDGASCSSKLNPQMPHMTSKATLLGSKPPTSVLFPNLEVIFTSPELHNVKSGRRNHHKQVASEIDEFDRVLFSTCVHFSNPYAPPPATASRSPLSGRPSAVAQGTVETVGDLAIKTLAAILECERALMGIEQAEDVDLVVAKDISDPRCKLMRRTIIHWIVGRAKVAVLSGSVRGNAGGASLADDGAAVLCGVRSARAWIDAELERLERGRAATAISCVRLHAIDTFHEFLQAPSEMEVLSIKSSDAQQKIQEIERLVVLKARSVLRSGDDVFRFLQAGMHAENDLTKLGTREVLEFSKKFFVNQTHTTQDPRHASLQAASRFFLGCSPTHELFPMAKSNHGLMSEEDLVKARKSDAHEDSVVMSIAAAIATQKALSFVQEGMLLIEGTKPCITNTE
eukprot:GDKJ01040777.1.p1 GENE.GDKJ01040777.1~~GDKJ01040777.1.p1  ORF type:complete len:916 (+),score=208.04 GDKJ01040777.1:147-2750(+)